MRRTRGEVETAEKSESDLDFFEEPAPRPHREPRPTMSRDSRRRVCNHLYATDEPARAAAGKQPAKGSADSNVELMGTSVAAISRLAGWKKKHLKRSWFGSLFGRFKKQPADADEVFEDEEIAGPIAPRRRRLGRKHRPRKRQLQTRSRPMRLPSPVSRRPSLPPNRRRKSAKSPDDPFDNFLNDLTLPGSGVILPCCRCSGATAPTRRSLGGASACSLPA